MANYLRPVTAPISCSWQCHRNRTPPSSEPGTDYGCAYGTAIAAAGNGKIIDVHNSTSGATGRYITLGLDDGNTVRYLHLSQVGKSVGNRVKRGDVIAKSGASGYGSEWGYGAHVHTTLWIGAAWATPTVDFEKYVGEDDMPLTPADKQIIKDSMFEFYRDVGKPPSGYSDWPFFRHSVWKQPITAQNPDGTTVKDDKGNPVQFTADGFLASTNAQVHDIRSGGGDVGATVHRAILYILAALGLLDTAGLGVLIYHLMNGGAS